jgi:4-amino-4-deoxy-L-arabinose transferase-like glycosyltransferase
MEIKENNFLPNKFSKTILFIIIATMSCRLLCLTAYPLMDPTESRYAEIAREMLVLDDWVTPHFNPQTTFLGKPPLTFWLTAITYKYLE